MFVNIDSGACAADKAVRDVDRVVIGKGFVDVNRCQIGRIVTSWRLVREVDARDRFAEVLSGADEAWDVVIGVVGVVRRWAGGWRRFRR